MLDRLPQPAQDPLDAGEVDQGRRLSCDPASPAVDRQRLGLAVGAFAELAALPVDVAEVAERGRLPVAPAGLAGEGARPPVVLDRLRVAAKRLVGVGDAQLGARLRLAVAVVLG